MIRIIAYGAFFLASFLICLYATFPWDAVKRRVLQEASRELGAQITARSLEPSWLTGFQAEGIEVSMEGEDAPLSIEQINARVSVLAFLTGGYGGSLKVPVGDGRIFADVSGDDDKLDITAEVETLELALLPALRYATGLALTGILEVSSDLSLGLSEPSESNGMLKIEGSDLETLEGSKIGSFPVPELVLGSLAWDLPLENGKLIVRNQRLTGPNVELGLNGEVVLAKPLNRSLVNLAVRFKPTPAFLKAEPMLGALLRNIDRYKGPDGFYGYQVSGTLKRPRLTPQRGS